MQTIKAKKAFGQNFLVDTTITTQIIQAMPKDDNLIVEIGPGLGDLTKYLVQQGPVIAFEVDRELCTHLTTAFKQPLSTKQLTLRCGDVLEAWSQEGTQKSLVDAPYNLVANLPYYIATTIILRALSDPQCRSLLVMVQKEVADKFSAQAGDKEFSALAVLTQTVGEAKSVLLVPPSAFNPPPKIDSAVLKITKHSSLEDEAFSHFLRIAFAQPRKTLAKNLSQHYPKESVLSILEALHLSQTVRPHETTTQQFHQLYFQLKGALYGREQQQQRKQPAQT
ncbi:MAG: 16S rRNA methyltransferase [Sulfuricurvum sp. PC08-66]|nr:MAG: 16S rRNA methyltransferase [Sulfuricurvum sp. PC08-66]